MAQETKNKGDFEEVLVAILGLILILVITGIAYFLIATSAPREMNDTNIRVLSCVGIWGLFFFLYGLVGVIQGKIVVGWGTVNQVRTTLSGAGALVAGGSTAIGGLLLLTPVAIYFVPELLSIIHPLATLLCGLLAPLLGWIGGTIIHSMSR
ncbi:MAG: hypothetical protein HY865_20510 [Chloroflexi bacterium]|nr:hypothetical protein [Chloroflexota bacterium]